MKIDSLDSLWIEICRNRTFLNATEFGKNRIKLFHETSPAGIFFKKPLHLEKHQIFSLVGFEPSITANFNKILCVSLFIQLTKVNFAELLNNLSKNFAAKTDHATLNKTRTNTQALHSFSFLTLHYISADNKVYFLRRFLTLLKTIIVFVLFHRHRHLGIVSLCVITKSLAKVSRYLISAKNRNEKKQEQKVIFLALQIANHFSSIRSLSKESCIGCLRNYCVQIEWLCSIKKRKKEKQKRELSVNVKAKKIVKKKSRDKKVKCHIARHVHMIK